MLSQQEQQETGAGGTAAGGAPARYSDRVVVVQGSKAAACKSLCSFSCLYFMHSRNSGLPQVLSVESPAMVAVGPRARELVPLARKLILLAHELVPGARELVPGARALVPGANVAFCSKIWTVRSSPSSHRTIFWFLLPSASVGLS